MVLSNVQIVSRVHLMQPHGNVVVVNMMDLPFVESVTSALNWILICRISINTDSKMVDWLTVLASGLLSFVVSIASFEVRLRREQSVEKSAEVEDWYTETAAHAAEVRRTWQRLWDSPEHPGSNLTEISNQMGLFERQISRHASSGEQLDVDPNVVDALDVLAEECRKPSEHSFHSNSDSEFIEFRTNILNAVERVEETLDEN